MTESLASHLSDRLRAALPFLDRVVGIVRLHERTINDGDSTRLERLPVPMSYTAEECERDVRYLVPDEQSGSILFFEDGGEIAIREGGITTREATLRLLLWLNPFKLTGRISENRLQAEIERALGVRRRFTVGDYRDVYVTASTLPAGAGLFGGYSFGAGTTPLLYPPYQLFGVELKCRYQFSPDCYLGPLPALDLNRTSCGLPPILELLLRGYPLVYPLVYPPPAPL